MSVVEPKTEVTPEVDNKAIEITFDNNTRDVKDGVVSVTVDRESFEKSSPLTPAQIKAHMQHLKAYNIAVAEATAELAIKESKGKDDVTHVRVESTIGGKQDKLITTLQVEKNYPAMNGRDAFSQPYLKQVIKSPNLIAKSKLKNIAKDLIGKL